MLQKEMEKVKANMPTSLPVAGFPITSNDPLTVFPFSKVYDNERVTYEVYVKRKKYDEENKQGEKINEFGSEEGDSMVAIVHIDGNNMGQHIQRKMAHVHTYHDAVIASRTISEEIENLFVGTCLKEVENNITSFCNARIALLCVKFFMDVLKREGNKYHACAGIFICHSHFPFSRGYYYAEQLCDNAKKKIENI